MSKLIKSIDKIEFLIIYLSLLFFSGFWFWGNTFMLGLPVVGSLLLWNKRPVKFNKTNLTIMILLLIIIISSELLNTQIYQNGSFSIKLLASAVAFVVIATLFSNSVERVGFKENYVSCMVIISLSSIIFNSLFLLSPSIIQMAPTLVDFNGKRGYFMIFSIISDFTRVGVQRNQGIFWEPGAFQFFLCIAYIFELSEEESKRRFWVLILLSVTMITTISTTGIIVVFLLTAFMFSYKQGRLRLFIFVLVSFTALSFVYFILPRLSGFWEYTLVGKIQSVFAYQPGDTGSAAVRVNSVTYLLKEYLRSPFLGIGTEGYTKVSSEAGHSMFTATPVNLIVKYGMLYGLIVFAGIWRFLRINFEVRASLVLFVILMVSISTESLNTNIFLLSISFYGHASYVRRSKPATYLGSTEQTEND